MNWRKNSKVKQIFTDEDLKHLAKNDDYWHNKNVDDAIYRLAAGAIYTIGFLAIVSLVYFIYYYAIGPNKDPSVLIKAASAILLYISGLVTPTIKTTLQKRRGR